MHRNRARVEASVPVTHEEDPGMKTRLTIILALACTIAACGKQGSEIAAQDTAEAPAASIPAATAPAPASTPAATEAPEPAPVEPVKPDVKPAVAALGQDEALALAQEGGCLACHKIETMLVGPAWRDVSAKYRGDAAAKARLVAMVKTGGQGNWTEATGGMPMPPYSPRVSDEDIDKLVTFILSL
jgi:cytochrome c